MARDASGNYTLPSGNPVVTGTTITTTWANDTLADLANEMTNSLSRSGQGGMTTTMTFLDGTPAAPAIAFTSEPALGFNRPAVGQVGVAAGGANVARFTDANQLELFRDATWKLVLTSGAAASDISFDDALTTIKGTDVQTWNAAADTQIATNVADIATNVADIATNVADIATNAADIITDGVAIVGVQDNLTAHETAVADAHPTSAITGLDTALNNHATSISTNAGDIDALEVETATYGSIVTKNFWTGTQAQYDGLTPDANTIYFVEE